MSINTNKIEDEQKYIVIFIDKEQYKVTDSELTEMVLRKLANIPEDYVIFKENTGRDEDLIIEADTTVCVKNGDHFYSHKKFINNGSVVANTLLLEDIQYLQNKGYYYELFEGDHRGKFLIIKDFPVSNKYNQSKVDLLIVIPHLYPMNGLDMFWVYPDLRLTVNNAYPPAAEHHEIFNNRNWQRFSRHYSWRPGIDSLSNHLSIVYKELNN